MLLDHSGKSRSEKSCTVCKDEGFTVAANRTCDYCEAEVCEGHHEWAMCSNCHDFMEGNTDRLEAKFGLK